MLVTIAHSFRGINRFIRKDDSVYSVHFATWQTVHDDIEAGLTVNIGKVVGRFRLRPAERSWIYREVWPSESSDGFEMQIEEPAGSKRIDFKSLRNMPTPEEARKRPAE